MSVELFRYITQWFVYQRPDDTNLEGLKLLVNALWFKSKFCIDNVLIIYNSKKGSELIKPGDINKENFTFVPGANSYLFHGNSLDCNVKTKFIQFCLNDKDARKYILSKEDMCYNNLLQSLPPQA